MPTFAHEVFRVGYCSPGVLLKLLRTMAAPTELNELLKGVKAGDRAALDRLLVVLYDDLHRVAHRRLRMSGNNQTLNTTGLVHESYLRLLKVGRVDVEDRNHFLVYSARVMRSIIVDLVRKKAAERHGGGAQSVTLNTNLAEGVSASEVQVVRINDALDELSHIEPALVQVVEMRYFVGLSEEEISAALGIAVRSVRRHWQKARLLLQVALEA
jgi:RNA polymerase sigma factor (TIGR02999 family)